MRKTKYYTLPELSKEFGISEYSLRHWAKAKWLFPVCVVGVKKFYTERSLEFAMEQSVKSKDARKPTSMEVFYMNLQREMRA